METARKATQEDLSTLVRLWEEALADLEGRRGGPALASGLVRADLSSHLTAALTSADSLLVIGSIDSVPVGLVSARAMLDRKEPVADLELIYVEPAAREVGVAECMLEIVVARCEQWGVTGMDAPALPGSRAAKAFFESHGFQARLLIMHRQIAPGEGAGAESARG